MSEPNRRTPFFGRDRELDRLADLFVQGTHLVTVTGAPGMGKTSLVQEFSNCVSRENEIACEAVVFCDLSGSRNEADVIAALSASLGLHLGAGEGSESSSELLGRAMASRGRTLLILDTFEQVAAYSGTTVASWLDLAPEALFLVTSRNRLRIRGEVCLELAPMVSADGLALFVDCAQRTRPDFTLAEHERGPAEELVKRLDGIPLAIELAAARTSIMPPSKILARLSKRFDLLKRGHSDAVERQATLRAAIDWSWELLDGSEKAVLAQSSVFRGGFSLEAAESIVVHEDADVLDVLDALCGKSLVQAQTHDRVEMRFVLFDSIMEYAAERLADAQEVDACQARHARYFTDEGESHVEEFGAPEGSDLAWFQENRENLVGVAQRDLEEHPELGIRAVLLLSHVMLRRGPYEENLRLLGSALSAVDAQTSASTHGRLLFSQGVAQSIVGEVEAAENSLLACIEVCREADMQPLLAKALLQRGVHDIRVGRLESARDWLEQGEEVARACGKTRVRARLLVSMGMAREAGADFEGAETRYLEALALARAIGGRWEEVRTRSKMGSLCSFVEGRRDEARAHFEWAHEEAHRIGELFIEAGTAYNLGRLNINEGRLDEADACLAVSLNAYLEMGNRSSEGFVRLAIGLLELERGDLDSSRDQLQRAITVLKAVGNSLARAYALTTMGLAELASGQPLLAINLSHSALEILQPLGHRVLMGITHCVLGFAAVCQEQSPEAELEAATELLEDSGWGEGQAMLDALRAVASVSESPSDRTMQHARARIALRSLQSLDSTVDLVGGDHVTDCLLVHREGRWFKPPGAARVDLSRKRTLRPLLLLLARKHEEEPGEALDVQDLFEGVWPGERILERARRNRVYVSIATLRKAGLDSVLDTRGDGYLLRREVELLWAD